MGFEGLNALGLQGRVTLVHGRGICFSGQISESAHFGTILEAVSVSALGRPNANPRIRGFVPVAKSTLLNGRPLARVIANRLAASVPACQSNSRANP